MKPKNELSNTYAKSIKTIPIQQHTSDPVNVPPKIFPIFIHNTHHSWSNQFDIANYIKLFQNTIQSNQISHKRS